MVQHCPPEDLLLEYAAGTLPEPLAVLVASQMTLAPETRREVARLEALGGALLDELPPATLSADALDNVLARLDETSETRPAEARPTETVVTQPSPGSEAARLPAPLRAYLDHTLTALPWRRRSASVAEYELLRAYPGFQTRLLRIRPGGRVPAHTHEGQEFTLVLEGAFSDETGRYARGDLAVASPEITHQPVAEDRETCICLAVTDAPLKMTGPLGRLLNRFVDI